MRFLHTSDLHLGIKLGNYSIIKEQEDMLDKIYNIAVGHNCQAIVIAGDIYDRKSPPPEAFMLFDKFKSNLHKAGISVLAISGNHDSDAVIAHDADILSESGLYFSKKYDGNITPVVLNDGYGDINFWLLPFLDRFIVKNSLGMENVISCDDEAVGIAIDKLNVDTMQRNVIISHQSLLDGNIGGIEKVAPIRYSSFDYVALGHIHSPQQIKHHVRQCGAPMKYSKKHASFIDADVPEKSRENRTSVLIVDIKDKKSPIAVEHVYLEPLNDVIELKGKFETLISERFYSTVRTDDDYIYITLTDEDMIYNAAYSLSEIYKKILCIDNENLKRSNHVSDEEKATQELSKGTYEMFGSLYRQQHDDNNDGITDDAASDIDEFGFNKAQREYLENIIYDIENKVVKKQ